MPESVSNRFGLNGKVALVSGGGRGIGKSLALGLARNGADLVVVGRTLEPLEALIDEVQKIGRRACAIKADIADCESLENVVAEAVERMGRLDVLVNNAAAGSELRRSEEVTPQEFDDLVRVNLKGTFFLTTSAARRMIDSGGGSIVNISSIVARVASPRAAVYGAMKAGVESLTRTLAVEWARYGVRVNAVAPGYVATDLTATSHMSEELLSYVRAGTPMRRMADPDEIVGAVVYLASNASSFQTGSTIVVDGGWTAW